MTYYIKKTKASDNSVIFDKRMETSLHQAIAGIVSAFPRCEQRKTDNGFVLRVWEHANYYIDTPPDYIFEITSKN